MQYTITLAKLNKLISTLKRELNSLPKGDNVLRFSVYPTEQPKDVLEGLKQAAKKEEAKSALYYELQATMFELDYTRKKLNYECGAARMMVNLELFNRQKQDQQQLNTYCHDGPVIKEAETYESAEQRLATFLEMQQKAGVVRQLNVSFMFREEDEIKKAVRQTNRKIVELTDKLVEINNSTKVTVEIPDAIAAILGLREET